MEHFLEGISICKVFTGGPALLRVVFCVHGNLCISVIKIFMIHFVLS